MQYQISGRSVKQNFWRAVSPIDPKIVYATIEAGPDEKGFYRSADKAENWEKRKSYISSGTGPHYYQEIFADPNVFDRVYQMDPEMMVTDDGGKTFRPSAPFLPIT